jgi:AMMECR1 domain-containing protein
MENKNLNNMLIDIAKGAIYSKLYDKDVINKEELIEKFPNFLKRAATFVTITIDGELRGCIGSLIAHNALLDDILSNAVKRTAKMGR